MKIFIPSWGRPEEVAGKTAQVFPDAVIVCPESQYAAYKENSPNMAFMPCPDSVEGNIARKRNWIRRNAGDKYFCMVDDDLKGFQMLEGNRQIEMSPALVYNMLENGFQMMEDLGTVLWGINVNTDPKCYMAYTPFNLLSPILGPFSGHKFDPAIVYDERLSLKEDYDLSLQVLRRYHKVLRLNKYSYNVGHLTNASGGCVDYRRMDLEQAQNELFQKKWGKKVIKFNMKKSVNPRVNVPLKGI